MPDVLAVGLAQLDTLGLVAGTPELGRPHALAAWSMQGGGPAATAACALAALGRAVAFAGKVGDDDHGTFVREGLADAGVDASAMVVEPGKISAVAFRLLEPSGRRTSFFTRGDVTPLGLEELRPGLLDGCRLLVVDGHEPEAQRVLAEMARNRRIPVVLDAGGGRPGTEALIRLADHVIASERLAAERGGSLPRALEALLAHGARSAVVKLGEDGCVGRDAAGDAVQVPALDVDIVDATGAGGVFLGAYCDALLDELPLRRRLERANAAAGLSCRKLGARAALPDRAAVDEAVRTGAA